MAFHQPQCGWFYRLNMTRFRKKNCGFNFRACKSNFRDALRLRVTGLAIALDISL